MIFLTFCLLTSIYYSSAERTIITVDPITGSDKADCFEAPTRSCKYVFQATQANVKTSTIILAEKTFNLNMTNPFNAADDVEFQGQSYDSKLLWNEHYDQPYFLVTGSNDIVLTTFTMEGISKTAVEIRNTGTITLSDIQIVRNDAKTMPNTWYYPYAIYDSTGVTIPLDDLTAIPVRDGSTPLPYYIYAQSVDGINLSGPAEKYHFAIEGVGLAALVQCKHATITNYAFSSHAGNKIYVNGDDEVSLENIDANNNPTPTTSLATLSNSVTSIATEVQKEVTRAITNTPPQRLSLPGRKASPLILTSKAGEGVVYCGALIYATGMKSVSITNAVLKEQHMGVVVIADTEKVELTDVTFEKNVMGYTPSVWLPKTGAAEFGGAGCSLTLSGVSGPVKLTQVSCSENKLTYDNWATTVLASASAASAAMEASGRAANEPGFVTSSLELIHSSVSSIVESSRLFERPATLAAPGYRRGLGVKSRGTALAPAARPRGTRPAHNGMDVVSADIWIAQPAKTPSTQENPIYTLDVTFTNDQMSYEETDDASFIVPAYKHLAPLTVNLRRSRTPRPSACLFVADAANLINATSLKATGCRGTAFAFVNFNALNITKVDIQNHVTQPNAFSESAIYIAGNTLYSETEEILTHSTVQIHDISAENVAVSELSRGPVVSNLHEDSGWNLGPGGRTGKGGEVAAGTVLSAYWMTEVKISNALIQHTTTTGDGGAFAFIDCRLITLNTILIEDSIAGNCGGAIFVSSSILDQIIATNLEISNCHAGSLGGGLSVPVNSGADMVAVITDSSFENCYSNEGGGVFIGSKTGAAPLSTTVAEAHLFNLTTTNTKFTNCQASYGGGFVVGSVEHITTLAFDKVTATECKSFLTGGGGFISGSGLEGTYKPVADAGLLVGINTEDEQERIGNPTEARLIITDCAFNSNQATGIGGGLFLHIVDYANATTYILDELAPSGVPYALISNTNFISNQVRGADFGVEHSLIGGGGLAQLNSKAAVPPPPPTNDDPPPAPKPTYNTHIVDVKFHKNVGGAYLALGSVQAVIDNVDFANNTGNTNRDDTTRPFHIECYNSLINILSTSKFADATGVTGENATHYWCDSTCVKHEDTFYKCWKPQNGTGKAPKLKEVNYKHYPRLPQLSINSINGLVVASPAILVSEKKDPFGPAPTATFRDAYDGTPYTLANISLVQTKTRTPSARRTWVNGRLVDSVNAWTLYDAEGDAIQMFPCNAKNQPKGSDLFTITTISDPVLQGFPPKIPKELWMSGTLDGMYWTQSFSIPIGPVPPADADKPWGWYSFFIMVGFVGLFFLIVGCLAIIRKIVQRNRKKGYVEIESSYASA